MFFASPDAYEENNRTLDIFPKSPKSPKSPKLTNTETLRKYKQRSESEDYKMKLPSMNEIKDCFFYKNKKKKRRLSDSIPATIDNDNVYLYDFELKSTSVNTSVHGFINSQPPSPENTPIATPKYGFILPSIFKSNADGTAEENYEFFCKNMTKELKQVAKLPITPKSSRDNLPSISDALPQAVDIIPPPTFSKSISRSDDNYEILAAGGERYHSRSLYIGKGSEMRYDAVRI